VWCNNNCQLLPLKNFTLSFCIIGARSGGDCVLKRGPTCSLLKLINHIPYSELVKSDGFLSQEAIENSCSALELTISGSGDFFNNQISFFFAPGCRVPFSFFVRQLPDKGASSKIVSFAASAEVLSSTFSRHARLGITDISLGS